MKLFSKPLVWSEVIWVLVLTLGILVSFCTLKAFGVEEGNAKGLSMVVTLVFVGAGLLVERAWIGRRWDRRFEGLTAEQASDELDKIFEEQIARGVITRAELDAARKDAKRNFERNRLL